MWIRCFDSPWPIRLPDSGDDGVLASGAVVCLAEPVSQFGVDIGEVGDADAMGEHGVETAGFFQASGGGDIFEIDTDIQALCSGGLEDGKLFGTADADVTFFRREFDIGAEGADGGGERIVDGAQGGFGAGVLGFDYFVVACGGRGFGSQGAQCDLIGVAVGEAMFLFEMFDEEFVFVEAGAAGDGDPGFDGFAGAGLQVAEHACHAFFG